MKPKRYNDGRDLDLSRLRSLLAYDPKSGVFTWKVRPSSNVEAGSKAGSKVGNGYILIRVEKCQVYAHRLAWFYVYGVWPDQQIDHVNGVRDNNSIGNLRLASQSQNTCNGVLRSTNTSGYRGVSWSKDKRKWVARIVKDKKQHVLGYFASKEEAYYAYLKAARELHGEFSQT